MISDPGGGRRWSWGGAALHSVCFGDEYVAFHEATASTNVFDEDTYRLLEALRHVDRPLTGPNLWSAAFGEAATESDCQALEETLEQLRQAGLVTATRT